MQLQPCKFSATALGSPVPLLDRIDIQVEVPALRYQELASHDAGEPGWNFESETPVSA